MKKILLLLVFMFLSASNYAGRFIPSNMLLFKLHQANVTTIEVLPQKKNWVYWATLGIKDNSKTLTLSPAVRVRDESNRYIVKNNLPFNIDKAIALRFNNAGMVDEIWVLTDLEVDTLQRRADAQN